MKLSTIMVCPAALLLLLLLAAIAKGKQARC
jgi:hypothetical protein